MTVQSSQRAQRRANTSQFVSGAAVLDVVRLGEPPVGEYDFVDRRRVFAKSGRLDLNQRPLRPERSALAKLSHAPSLVAKSF